MKPIKRRSFNKTISRAVISYALLESLFATESIGKSILPITRHWAIRLQEMCRDLKIQKISQSAWQENVENLFKELELSELLRFIDFQKLTERIQLPDLGVGTTPVQFPKLEGLDDRVVFVKKIFGVKKDRAIIPHGHSNMASAHLVLKGGFDLKHFEKIQQNSQHLIVKPTIERIAGVGSVSSISDEKDNIHWFIAREAQNYTLDIIMLDLNGMHYDIHNLDMEKAQAVEGDQLRVPLLDVETALAKYGKIHH